MTGWTAILLAGQRPGVDPLAAHFGETWKALVKIGGEAMLSRTTGTLIACPSVERVLILAQDPAALTAGADTAWIAGEPKVGFLASEASISQSVSKASRSSGSRWPLLVTTADHPLLTPLMVEAFLFEAAGADVAAGVVERQTLLASYPDSRRTWLRFRGGAYSGANLFALTSPRAEAALDLWAGIEQDRKKGWRIVGALGPGLLIGAATGMLTLNQAMRRASARLGIEAKAVVLPMAEAAIDVDKPDDHRLAERILAARP